MLQQFEQREEQQIHEECDAVHYSNAYENH